MTGVVTEADILQGLTERLRGRPVADDLRALVALQVAAGPDGYPPDHPLRRTNTSIFGPGEQHSSLTHDYLSDEDRADEELMLTIAAGDKVLRHGAWVASTDNSHVIGYWLHPDEPADQPPVIFTYDTEASFDLMPGHTLVEALIFQTAGFDDDRFAELASAFAAYGLPISAARPDDLPVRKVVAKPDVLHDRYYDDLAGRAGRL